MSNPHDEKSEKETGRPTKFTQKLADYICEKIANSSEGLNRLHESEPDKFPHRSTVIRWLAENEAFRDQYARARELQADFIADEIIEIADTCRIGKKTKTVKKGKKTEIEVTEGDMIERSRLQIDARKWKASKLAPKKYGDKPGELEDKEITIRVVEE